MQVCLWHLECGKLYGAKRSPLSHKNVFFLHVHLGNSEDIILKLGCQSRSISEKAMLFFTAHGKKDWKREMLPFLVNLENLITDF